MSKKWVSSNRFAQVIFNMFLSTSSILFFYHIRADIHRLVSEIPVDSSFIYGSLIFVVVAIAIIAAIYEQRVLSRKGQSPKIFLVQSILSTAILLSSGLVIVALIGLLLD
jgi:hypothetical protein